MIDYKLLLRTSWIFLLNYFLFDLFCEKEGHSLSCVENETALFSVVKTLIVGLCLYIPFFVRNYQSVSLSDPNFPKKKESVAYSPLFSFRDHLNDNSGRILLDVSMMIISSYSVSVYAGYRYTRNLSSMLTIGHLATFACLILPAFLLRKINANRLMSNNRFASIFGNPSQEVMDKIKPKLTDWVTSFIKKSPFLVMATTDSQGNCKASPRGGKAGFVEVLDEHYLFLPNVRGNNLYESYRNLRENPKVSLCFMIPGVGEVARVGGVAVVCQATTDTLFSSSMSRRPKKGLIIRVFESYCHCSQSLKRGKLWNTELIEKHTTIRPVPQPPWKH